MRALIVVVALAAGACETPLASTDEVVALPDGAIVRRSRKSHDELVRIDDSGKVVWSRELMPRAQMASLVVRDDLVTVRRVLPKIFAMRFVYLDAYSLADGGRRWSTLLAGFDDVAADSLSLGASPIPSVRDEALLAEIIVHHHPEVWLLRIDPRTGEVRARESINGADRVVAHGPGLHVEFGDSVTHLTGGHEVRPSAAWGCIRASEYMNLEHELHSNDVWTVSTTSGRRAMDSTIVQNGLFVGCAFYGELLVVETRRDWASVWHLVNREGHVVASLPLSGRETDGEWSRRRYPQAATLGGELPRYVTLAIHSESSANRLMMIDLEHRTAVPTIELQSGASIFRVNDVWYIVEFTLITTRIIAIDARTGHVLAAARIEMPGGGRSIRPPNVGSSGIWLLGSELLPTDGQQMARLDPRTLQPLLVSGGAIVSDALRDADLQRLVTAVSP